MKLTAMLGAVALTAASMVSSAPIPVLTTHDTTQDMKPEDREIELRKLWLDLQKQKPKVQSKKAKATPDAWKNWASKGERTPQPTQSLPAFESRPSPSTTRPTTRAPRGQVMDKDDLYDIWAKKDDEPSRSTRVFKAFESRPNYFTLPVLDTDAKKFDDLGHASGSDVKVLDVTESMFHGFHL